MKKNIIDKIEEVVQYRFSDKSLLVQAFTHSSYANMENTADNERMEFFGDAILEYLSSEYLFDHYRTLSEGELSTIRAKIVSAEGLYPVVERLGLMQYLQVLTAELSRKTAANLYEAVLCAIYLDGGMSKARDFFLYSLQDEFGRVSIAQTKDSKTLLQEYCQKNKKTVVYKFADKEGPDNRPIFRCALYIDDIKQTEGVGSSKKSAEQDAASKLVKKWRID